VKPFLERHDCAGFMAMSMTSAFAAEMLVLPQLARLLEEENTWRFTEASKAVIRDLIDGIGSGRYVA